jgi:hypothetical protein
MPWVSHISKPSQPMAFSDGKIRFVWCTDAHVVNNDTDAQVIALEKAINDCNEWRPNAFICTGDLCSNRLDQVRRWFYHTWQCQRPVYVAIGEHDLSEYSPGSYGNPDMNEVAGEAAMDLGPPFWYSQMLTSGDESFAALCLFLDDIFYDDDPTPLDPPGNSDYHEPGDRWGISDLTPGGGWYKLIPQAELDWITATLATYESDVVLIFIHHPPVDSSHISNLVALADTLQPDSRPMIGFCGHAHSQASTETLTTTDTLRSFTFYLMTDMSTSYAWCRVTLGFDGDITVDGLDIYNFTDPGGYTVDSPPFTLI